METHAIVDHVHNTAPWRLIWFLLSGIWIKEEEERAEREDKHLHKLFVMRLLLVCLWWQTFWVGLTIKLGVDCCCVETTSTHFVWLLIVWLLSLRKSFAREHRNASISTDRFDVFINQKLFTLPYCLTYDWKLIFLLRKRDGRRAEKMRVATNWARFAVSAYNFSPTNLVWFTTTFAFSKSYPLFPTEALTRKKTISFDR